MRRMASLLDTGEQDSRVLECNEVFATFWMIYWDNKDRYLLMHRDLERFLSYPFSFMYDLLHDFTLLHVLPHGLFPFPYLLS